MVDKPREINVQVIVALIGVTGVISAAVLGNWDKLFPQRSEPAATAAASAQPAPPALPVSDTSEVTRLSKASDQAYGAAADALEGVASQIEAAGSVPPIAGRWHDDSGYAYLIQQQGSQFQYRMLQGASEMSTGRGRIVGRTLRYSYASDGGNGNCQGELAAGDRAIAGRCSDAESGKSWDFEINR